MTYRLYWDDILFKLKYRGRKYRPKSPLEVYYTIETYFGLHNYKYSKGKFKRR